MSPIKIVIGAAMLVLAVGNVLKVVRKAQAQNTDVSAYTASSMKDSEISD